jgi:hypothetical protein
MIPKQLSAAADTPTNSYVTLKYKFYDILFSFDIAGTGTVLTCLIQYTIMYFMHHLSHAKHICQDGHPFPLLV